MKLIYSKIKLKFLSNAQPSTRKAKVVLKEINKTFEILSPVLALSKEPASNYNLA